MLDAATYTPRLKAKYANEIRKAMKEEFGYKNDMQIPKLDKIPKKELLRKENGRSRYLKAILKIKLTHKITGFCDGKATSLTRFASEIEEIGFSARPNYDLLRSILHELIANEQSIRLNEIFTPRQCVTIRRAGMK